MPISTKGYPVVPSDSKTNDAAMQQMVFGLLWNESLWERARGNVDGLTAISDATRTAGTVEGADQINYDHRGAHIICTRSTGNAHLLLTIQGKDELMDRYYTVATGVTLSGTGVAAFIVYPGNSVAAASVTGGKFNESLPRTWRVRVVPSTSPTAAYAVGYSLIK